jgi:hypothetical protein
VEVLTRDWQPIPGFTATDAREIQGDALDHPAQWSHNADVHKLLGQQVRLKFHMVRARIHAMSFTDHDRPLGPGRPQVPGEALVREQATSKGNDSVRSYALRHDSIRYRTRLITHIPHP